MTVSFVTPVEILTGVSTALLFGAVAAVLVGGAGYLIASVTDGALPGVVGGAVTGAIAAAGASAAGVVDTGTIQPGLYLGFGLVVVLGLYATSWGRRLAADLPRAGGPIERTRPLAAEAIDSVDAMGQVTIRPSGGVREFEGYPPLGPGLRTALEEGSWRLPADLPLPALEARLEDRLRTAYGLEAAAVSVDRRGRATITAAPPVNGLAKDVPEGRRAVSIRVLLPTGLAPGDDVVAVTDSASVSGTVLSATADVPAADGGQRTASATAGVPPEPTASRDPTGAASAVATGGEGRVTVAVPTTDAETLLEADRARVAVTPRGTTHEFEAISILERGDVVIRKVTLTEPIREAVADDGTDLTVFAVRRTGASDDGASHEHEWRFEPDHAALPVGAEAFVLGTDAPVFDVEPAAVDPALPEVSQ